MAAQTKEPSIHDVFQEKLAHFTWFSLQHAFMDPVLSKQFSPGDDKRLRDALSALNKASPEDVSLYLKQTFGTSAHANLLKKLNSDAEPTEMEVVYLLTSLLNISQECGHLLVQDEEARLKFWKYLQCFCDLSSLFEGI